VFGEMEVLDAVERDLRPLTVAQSASCCCCSCKSRADLLVRIITSDGNPVIGATLRLKATVGRGFSRTATLARTNRAELESVTVGNRTLEAELALHFPAIARGNTRVRVNADNTLDLVLDPVVMHLHVDADRDGRVDDAPQAAWQWSRRSGAVILCNAGHPAPQLAPLEIRRVQPGGSPPLAGWHLALSVDHPEAIRIFDQDRTSVLIDQQHPSHTFDSPDFATRQLYMEATKFPDRTFHGLVTLRLELTDDRGNPAPAETAEVQVAPWLMLSHFQPVDRVYIAKGQGFFVGRSKAGPLRTGLARANFDQVETCEIFSTDFAQDVVKVGCSHMPGAAKHVAIPSPAASKSISAAVGPLLQSAGLYFPPISDVGSPDSSESDDDDNPASGPNGLGNLQVFPPVPDYPYGRICHGTDISGDFVAFLQAQRLQAPFGLDATWMYTGHVDELFIAVPGRPARASKSDSRPERKDKERKDKEELTAPLLLPVSEPRQGADFVILIPSPRLALGILDSNPKATFAKLCGTSADDRRIIQPVLAEHFFSADVKIALNKDGGFMPGRDLAEYNAELEQSFLAVARALGRNLGLGEESFVPVPVLFTPKDRKAAALTSNLVNLLVVAPDRCLFPKAWGPEIEGRDLFDEAMIDTLRRCGVSAAPVDVWPYHLSYGELHCATAALRTLPGAEVRWWRDWA
jgi:hypothetical protein